jgi:maltose alpha-D-glucosyltransferase/alpha-amylase
VYGYQAINVESQKRVPHSLLNWMKSLIAVRKSTKVFSRGSLEFLRPSNHRVLAYVRQLDAEKILVVNNLSHSAQAVELDLGPYKGCIPIEMSGRNLFPRLGDLPDLLTMGPYESYGFRLRRL